MKISNINPGENFEECLAKYDAYDSENCFKSSSNVSEEFIDNNIGFMEFSLITS